MIPVFFLRESQLLKAKKMKKSEKYSFFRFCLLCKGKSKVYIMNDTISSFFV